MSHAEMFDLFRPLKCVYVLDKLYIQFFFNLKPFILPKSPASNISSHYQSWIKYKGHENKRIDHQLKKLQIAK